METFSGRRGPDWQRKPGTEAAVASRQYSNIKIAVNSEGRRLRRIPKVKGVDRPNTTHKLVIV